MRNHEPNDFAFDNFECSISTPWDGDEIELCFGDAHRVAWRALAVTELCTSADDPPELSFGDDGEELPPPTPRLRGMDVELGRVTAERRYANGTADTLTGFEVELHLEPGPWSEIRVRRRGRGTALWSPRFEGLFVRATRSLCDAKVPPDVRLPRSAPRRCTAAALVKDHWANGGAQLSGDELDDFWNPGTEVDVLRLLAAIEAGATHRARSPADFEEDRTLDGEWAVVRNTDRSIRLVTPLAIEILRVDVVGHAQPGFLTARYFLSIDIDAHGRVEDVSIRAARDGTFDAEADDSASLFANRDEDDLEHLLSKLTSVAYTAVTWVVDEHLKEETFEEEASDIAG